MGGLFRLSWSRLPSIWKFRSLVWPLAGVVITVLIVRKASTAKDLADLIQAIASLAWPCVVITVVRWFRPEIRNVITRLKKGKLLGTEIELNELQVKSEQATEKVILAHLSARQEGQTINAASTVDGAKNVAAVENAVEEVLREAARSPKLGLMLLAAKLERAAREAAEAAGLAGTGRYTAYNWIKSLVIANLLPREGAEAFVLFLNVRNRIVHGQDAEDADIARAIDSGVQLLKILIAIPKPPGQASAP